MEGRLKEIISIIKEEYPDSSEDEIKEAIINYVESNSFEIVAKIKLPSSKKLEKSTREDMYRATRSVVKLHKLQEDQSKIETISALERIQEDLSNRGMRSAADRYTKYIKDIGGASATKKETLMYVGSDLTEQIIQEETVEESDVRTNRKLKELAEDASD
jgi:hypothetical protein